MKTRSDDLHLLLSVVDSGGFSAAADNLGVQVAKVSRAVSRIESQLNVTLLNRTTRRIELTEEGRRFIKQVRRGLQRLQDAEDELLEGDEIPRGRLRVDAASPFVIHQLVPLVQEFRQAYPEVELELTSNEGFIDLLEKRTDVAIRVGKLNDSSLNARPLGQSPLYIVASPDYLSRAGFPRHPDELNQHSLIGFVGARVLNKWPLSGVGEITPTLTASSGEIVRQLALAGNGITCLSGFMVREDLAEGRLVTLFEAFRHKDSERESVNAVFYKSSAVSKRISVFLDFLQPRLEL